MSYQDPPAYTAEDLLVMPDQELMDQWHHAQEATAHLRQLIDGQQALQSWDRHKRQLYAELLERGLVG